MDEKRRRLAMRAGVLATMAGLTGCQSFQGLHWGWNRTDGGDSRNVSYRPVYESFRGRPLYPGGYAGINNNADSFRGALVPATTPGLVDGPAPNVSVNQGSWDAR